MDRAAALAPLGDLDASAAAARRRPLHLAARASAPECRSVNTWPVLASEADDVMLGAAIVLPDHPSLAPESLGGLFDSTEIEEALLLHVQALSDGERDEIAAGDPAVARDDRARRSGDARGADDAARARRGPRPGDERAAGAVAGRPRPDARRGRGRRSTGGPSGAATASCCDPSPEADLRRGCSTAHRDDRADLRRLRRQGATSASSPTGSPARTCCARRAGSCSSSRPRWRCV